jgi:hypothetical protein
LASGVIGFGDTSRVSSYATVYLGDGREICSFRNGVDELFFILFTRDDWFELGGREALQRAPHRYSDLDVDEAKIIGFRATARALRDRLDVMDVDLRTVSTELGGLVAESISMRTAPYIAAVDDAVLSEHYSKELDVLTRLDWASWVNRLRSEINSGASLSDARGSRDAGSASGLLSLWDGHDPRYVLRALLEAVPDDEMITLDLTDLADGGWLSPDVDPKDLARDFVAYANHGGLPPIVLTEGSFDAEVLTAGVQVRRPHLAGFIRFPDFSHRPEGGASALRQTVRRSPPQASPTGSSHCSTTMPPRVTSLEPLTSRDFRRT